jgi:hypothetical protein
MSDGWNKVNRAVKKALQEVTLAQMNALPPALRVMEEQQ